MPTGAAQPPSSATIGPERSAATSSIAASTATAARTAIPTTRCSAAERLPTTVIAAPSIGKSTGRVTTVVTGTTPMPGKPH